MLKKARNIWYSAETIADTDFADDIAPFANTPAQAKFLLHNLEQAVLVSTQIKQSIWVLNEKEPSPL